MNFQDLPLQPESFAALEKKGFTEATPIQAQTIPLLLEGHDVIGQAQTGTGKTAAFGIPVMEAAARGEKSLILTPTRELAMQVEKELRELGHAKMACLIGGVPVYKHVKILKGNPTVMVATPGRVVDLLNRGELNLDVAMFVLDEADEMLSMGFQDELDAIVEQLPEKRQNVLFTATLAKNVERLAKKTLTDPKTVRIGKTTSENLDQRYAVCKASERVDAYNRIMEAEEPRAALLFCKTRARVDELADYLPGEALHGGMQQGQRATVMRRFRNGLTNLLIATDVAARGLDIDEVDLVLHDEPAGDTDTYVHRIGRTARAGRSGRSIIFVGPGKVRRLAPIRKLAGNLEEYNIPTDEKIAKIRIGRVLDELKDLEVDIGQWAYNRALKDGFSPEEIAKRALEHILKIPEKPEVDESETVPLCIKVGKIDDINPGTIVATLTNKAGLTANQIGRIDLLPRMSVIEVPASEAERLIADLDTVKIGNQWCKPRIAEDWRYKTSPKQY